MIAWIALIVLLVCFAMMAWQFRGGTSCALCGVRLEWNPVRRRIWRAHQVAFCDKCMPGSAQGALAEVNVIPPVLVTCCDCDLTFSEGKDHWCSYLLGRVEWSRARVKKP